MLSHADAVAVGDLGDRDAAGDGGLEIGVVRTDSGRDDQLQVGGLGEPLRRQIRGPERLRDDDVGVGQVAIELGVRALLVGRDDEFVTQPSRYVRRPSSPDTLTEQLSRGEVDALRRGQRLTVRVADSSGSPSRAYSVGHAADRVVSTERKAPSPCEAPLRWEIVTYAILWTPLDPRQWNSDRFRRCSDLCFGSPAPVAWQSAGRGSDPPAAIPRGACPRTAFRPCRRRLSRVPAGIIRRDPKTRERTRCDDRPAQAAVHRVHPEGERVVAGAHRILAERDALLVDLARMRDGLSATLRIGAISTAIPISPLLTEPFCDRHPLAGVRIEVCSSREISRRSGEFDLDVGLTHLDFEGLQGLHRQPLYTEKSMLLTPDDNELADRDVVSWAEAPQTRCAHWDVGSRTQDIGLHDSQRGRGVSPVIETATVDALYSHVATRRWSSIVADPWLTRSASAGHASGELDAQPRNSTVGLVWSAQRHESVVATALSTPFATWTWPGTRLGAGRCTKRREPRCRTIVLSPAAGLSRRSATRPVAHRVPDHRVGLGRHVPVLRCRMPSPEQRAQPGVRIQRRRTAHLIHRGQHGAAVSIT